MVVTNEQTDKHATMQQESESESKKQTDTHIHTSKLTPSNRQTKKKHKPYKKQTSNSNRYVYKKTKKQRNNTNKHIEIKQTEKMLID